MCIRDSNCFDSEQHADVESWLIKVIELDLQVNVCATAVDLLCELGTEAAIDPLVQLKARFTFQPYIQFAAEDVYKRQTSFGHRKPKEWTFFLPRSKDL